MSLTLAKTWVNTTVRQPQAGARARRLIDQASAKAGTATATLIVGPQLSSSGKCFLSRWDGQELIVLELNHEQQRNWSIYPKGMYEEFQSEIWPAPTTSTESVVSLEVESIDSRDECDGWKPLSGVCLADPQKTRFEVIRNCAIRAQYFRPQLTRPVTQMWYSNENLYLNRAELRFQFPPFFSEKNPQSFDGALMVFIQLFTADDWSHGIGCRCISNVSHAILS